MNIKLLSNKAKIPTKGSAGAAGYDLYTTETYELKVGERHAFKTDISMAIPIGIYGRIAPRSGHALKKGIDVMAGVDDPDYRGEVKVILINLGQEPFNVTDGDKIAQIIFEHYTEHEFNVVNDLDTTNRGENGFGSSDLKIAPNQSILSPLDIKSNKISINLPVPIEPQSIKKQPEIKSPILEAYKKHEVVTHTPYEQQIKEQLK